MAGFMIKASYTTGDSFHTEQTSDILGIVWKDLDHAKKGLATLKEHHDYYEKNNDRWYRGSLTDKDLEKVYARPWYIIPTESYMSDYWQWSIHLYTDDDTLHVVHIPYHGYFEHLHSLEIVANIDDEDSDMRVTF